ncbi:hypothetical protein THOM_2429 [Trachipleistophora hominis]|uniref:Uncharacterized protein n=1 Tax=Trachipleistophora hominis TaxID=72359 RepID=L7JTJ5_TRAHO|nr:hypothetical protein THOM_2429 [Trachipleistophora hominis]
MFRYYFFLYPMFRTLCEHGRNGKIHSFGRIKEVLNCNTVIIEYKTLVLRFVCDDVGVTCREGGWIRFYGYLEDDAILGTFYVCLDGVDINLIEKVAFYVKRAKKHLWIAR